MKTRLITLLTIVLMTALSSQAFAYFENNHLIEVVYNGTTAERAIDLGDLSTLSLDDIASRVTLTGAGSINLAALGASSWSQLKVGLFAYSGSSYQEYFANTLTTNPGINTANRTGFGNAYSSVANTYYRTTLGGTTSQIVDGLPTNSNSYRAKMNQTGTNPGGYAAFNHAPATGEASLAALDTGGSVTMYLYHFNLVTAVPGANADYMGKLTLLADGSTVADATPIPASLLLFGSGLLGLVGLKKKGAEITA
jgi:hypothetical protein